MKKLFLLLSTGVLLLYGLFVILKEDSSPSQVKSRVAVTPKSVLRPPTNLARKQTDRGQAGQIALSSKPFRANKPKSAATIRKPIPLAKKTHLTIEDLTELQEAEEREREEEEKSLLGKTDQPDKYALLHRLIRTREGAEGPEYAMNYKFKALEDARTHLNQNRSTRVAPLNWSERGPGNVPGRTRGLLVLPTDSQKNTWLAGSASGGIWKTTDAGSN